MSMLRPLDSSETQLPDSHKFLRVHRGDPVSMINNFSKMRVQYKPELGGIAINSQVYMDSSEEMGYQDAELLSRSSFSELEIQNVLREMKFQAYNAPISPLSPLDAIGISETSYQSFVPHHQGSDASFFHCQDPFYNGTALAGSFVAKQSQYRGIPFSQKSASGESLLSNESLTNKFTSYYPHLLLDDLSTVDVQGGGFNKEHPECVRQRLQELEKELFSDDESSVFFSAQELGKEWVDTIEGYLLEDSIINSPMESTNGSGCSDGSKDYQPITNSAVQAASEEYSTCNSQSSLSQEVHAEKITKDLLYQCALAVADDNVDLALQEIAKLREVVSIQGDPTERLAAYMVEGLAARIASTGQGLYKALRCKEAPSFDMLSAMQILFEVCPCFKFGYMAANSAICEAFENEGRVHIIDFEMGQGIQYMNLIKAFSERPGGPPAVRITGVDDPESIKRSVGGLGIIGKRLEKYAETIGVSLEFIPVADSVVDIQAHMFDIRPNEALAVNFALHLHHMPDESVSTKNPRDRLLRMVKSFNPRIVTHVEQEVNTNTSPFLPRFMEVLNYYSAVFESLDVTLPRDSKDRMNVEKQCLARDIVNIIACEGAERVERYEMAGKWRARMTMAGFTAYPLSSYVLKSVESLLRSYCDSYTIKEAGGALYFGWRERPLIVASAWH